MTKKADAPIIVHVNGPEFPLLTLPADAKAYYVSIDKSTPVDHDQLHAELDKQLSALSFTHVVTSGASTDDVTVALWAAQNGVTFAACGNPYQDGSNKKGGSPYGRRDEAIGKCSAIVGALIYIGKDQMSAPLNEDGTRRKSVPMQAFMTLSGHAGRFTTQLINPA